MVANFSYRSTTTPSEKKKMPKHTTEPAAPGLFRFYISEVCALRREESEKGRERGGGERDRRS